MEVCREAVRNLEKQLAKLCVNPFVELLNEG